MDQTQETLAALQKFLSGEGPMLLVRHAIWESRAFYWRTGTGKMQHSAGCRAALAEGNSPDDVVQEAFIRTIDGRRPWNREKHPDIFEHLKLIVTSMTRNLASSGDNRMVCAIPKHEDGKVREDLLPVEVMALSVDGRLDGQPKAPEPEVVELDPGEAEPPEATLLRQAEGPAAIELDNKVFDAISDDDELLQVYEHRMAGKKVEEIATLMSLSPKDAYRLTQKLRRRLKPVFRDHAK